MLSEAVKVIVRCRPMNSREKGLKCKPCVFMDPEISKCSIVNLNDSTALPKSFTFDGVYYTDSTTEQIYNEIAYPLVEGVLEGYNGTVFAYGQTGCGKSFSMQGIHDPATQRGIIPRSFEHIFEEIDASENMKYLVHASYLEIYNEEIRDLLGVDIKKKLELKEHPDKGVYVPDISLHPVHNTAECEALMERGWKNRATGATLMNADSSRSHSIFTINIEMMQTNTDDQSHIRKGKLNLVDLAGSERQSKTQASGDRLKEATNINLSLSALGNVISALVDGKSKHIPYRDSKLTRLLKDSLGGNTKTMMVACLSPADNNYDETISTLRYANRAKNIKNKPKINEDPKDAMLREYQDEIDKLKAMLENQPQDGGGGSELGDYGVNEALLEEERNRMRSQYESEIAEMRTKMEREKQTKAQMQAEVEAMKNEYENKLKALETRAKTAAKRSLSRQHSIDAHGNVVVTGPDPSSPVQVVVNKKEMNLEQQAALEKLKKLQMEMIDGGKRAGDKNLKERRKQKKKAAENRLKALGEALGHVDDEDGVLLKVYDDIQEELKIKTDALKQGKQKIKALDAEIRDLQQEFEDDRTDYLDTIRKQDQQLKLLQQIVEKIQPTIRKECNYSNIEKIKQDAIWNDESQRWRIPDLITQKTKLPPAGSNKGKNAGHHIIQNGGTISNGDIMSDVEHTTEVVDDQETDQVLQQKLAKSEEEDVVGTYFKPIRASKLMAQAQESQRVGSNSKSLSNPGGKPTNLSGSSNLSSSFNSGLNTFGLNNSYGNNNGFSSGANSLNNSPQFNSTNNSLNSQQKKELPSWLGGGSINNGSSYSTDLTRKPTRLEALPNMDKKNSRTQKRSGPILNTMGTF